MITLLAMTQFSCSKEVVEKETGITLKGQLVVVGSEPFTSFAIEDSLGHITKIAPDKDFGKILNKLQGQSITVKGKTYSVLNELIIDSINKR